MPHKADQSWYVKAKKLPFHSLTNTGLSNIKWGAGNETTSSITRTIKGDSIFSATADITTNDKSCPAQGKQTVKVYPTTQITIKGGGAVCLEGEVTFNANGGESYNWHISKAEAGTIISNSSDSSEITVKNIKEGFSIYATGTDVNGCSSERSADSFVTILLMLHKSKASCGRGSEA